MGRSANHHQTFIELHKVTRTFNVSGARAVDAIVDITLRIDPGEFVCITGPSGSGKSTLLNILGCLDRLTSGSYRFGGKDLSGLTDDGLAQLRRKAFGFVFQGYNLLDSVSAQGNVELPLTYTMPDRRNRRAHAHQLLTAIGMDDRVAHRAGELSGGEQQRVAIARALANGAQVVIADEPTAALNSEQSIEIMSLLKQLANRGHAVVVASHDPTVAAQATRYIELQDGRLVRDTKGPDETHPSTPFATTQQETGATPPQAETARFATSAITNAMASLRSRCWRPAIILGCVITSVWCLVGLLSLIQGAYWQSMEIIGRMGADRFLVYQVVHSIDQIANATFSFDDIAEIEANVANVGRVLPRRGGTRTILYKDQAYNAVVHATAEDVPEARAADFREWPVAQGTFLNELDRTESRQVAVLGRPVRDGLFGPGVDAVGEGITINREPFVVKGVMGPYPELADRGTLVGTAKEQYLRSLESVIYIPFGTAAGIVFGDDEPVSFVVEVKDIRYIDETTADVRDVLIRRRGRENFAMRLPVEYAFSYHHLARTHKGVLIAVTAVGLVLAGLGVSSVMMVSVAERTREIGIRMAVGARRVDVLGQFLVEALVPAVVGGALGLALGYSTGSVFEGATETTVTFEPWFIPVALACSVVTGLAFGLVPARRAARLDPITALANE